MNRLATLVLLAAAPAWAAGARVAVHPLVLRGVSAEQAETLQARFDVALARVPDIRIAGVGAIEDALSTPAGRGCEVDDACLRHLAGATESLYAVFVLLRTNPLGEELILTARVLRADGALLRQVAREARLRGGVVETGGAMLGELVKALALDELPATPPVVGLLPSTSGCAAPPEYLARRPAGLVVLGVGGATLVAGGVLAGVALAGQGTLHLDAHGAVPQNQIARATTVLNQGHAAAVLIPIGAVMAITGAALALWPATTGDVGVSIGAGASGAGVLVGGALP